jgi:O-acetylserine/cysteine efflux transporter
MKPVHVLLMICTTAVWGFNFVAIRVALEVFSPQQMAFARAVITLVILLPWWKPFQPVAWKLLLAALAIGTMAFYLLYEAISTTESLTTVAVATQLMPPLSAILALMFFHEHVTARQWAGILIATIGAVYLAGITKSSLSLAALGAWIAAIAVVPMGIVAAVSGPLLPDLGLMQTQHWLAFVFAVVISALMGQAVLFFLYHRYPISSVAPWVLLVPLFAGLSSVLVYQESISLTLVLGGAVVITGVWVQQRGTKAVSPRPPVQ